MHAPAFDVIEVGRMAVLQDPQGAFFIVWEPRARLRRRARERARCARVERAASPDLDASSAFYSELFGWTMAPFEGSPEPLLSIKNATPTTAGCR